MNPMNSIKYPNCGGGTKQHKPQNLQIASRSSGLTGRINTTEVERISQEAEVIKTTSADRLIKAKPNLKRTLENAIRSIFASDRETLSHVWDQIERRNNL